MSNLITRTDSYKVTHWSQFPKGTQFTYYYTESRGGVYPTITVAGLLHLAKLLDTRITKQDVDEAKVLFDAHFGAEVFNYDGFMRIVNEFEGRLPLNLVGLPEGTRVPTGFPVAALMPTAEGFEWLPGYFEPIKLRSIWYPTTVATIASYARDAVVEYMDKTSDLEGPDRDFVIDTRLHDFGSRGVSSGESSELGGYAHQLLFNGTDNVESMVYINRFFNLTGAPSGSVPAREHSTTVIFDEEDDAFLNSINQYKGMAYACVMDSYSFRKAVERCSTGKIKQAILDNGGTFVFRPDSGDMLDNILFALETLGKSFGTDRNSKGYKVLHPAVRIIQGDGIDNADTVRRILSWMETKGWSAENIVFGMGGGLLQKADRDTQKFVTKLSFAIIDGEHKAVSKSPEDAPWKASKRGPVTSYFTGTEWKVGNYIEMESEEVNAPIRFVNYYQYDPLCEENGFDTYVRTEEFNEVRERARKEV